MNLLVLGAGGLVGSTLVDRCLNRSVEVVGTYHSEPPVFEIELEHHDIRDTAAFKTLLNEYQPDFVVNCAALTDVDGCESDPETAFEINGAAPGKLASICMEFGVRFVHLSTDYVFNGEDVKPYVETAPTEPIQMYGKSKLIGERSVLEATNESLILRLSFVYGARGDTNEIIGFPSWVRENLRANKKIPLFTDQYFTPTRAGQASETILDLLDEQTKGIYHISSRSCVTPYDFGENIANILERSEKYLNESSRSDLVRRADRPKYTCLDVSKVQKVLNRSQPTLEEDLQAIKSHL